MINKIIKNININIIKLIELLFVLYILVPLNVSEIYTRSFFLIFGGSYQETVIGSI